MENARQRKLYQLLFIGPAVIFFTIILVIPFFMSLYYSFTEWNGVSTTVTWIGIENYKKIMFNDPDYYKSFLFTFRYAIVSVILTNLVGFLLALLLTQALKLRNILRTIFFMPNVIGGLLLGFIWSFIFVKGFASIGELTGLAFFNLPWLGDAPTAFWGLIIVTVWKGAGYVMVIYIAGLTNVPKDMIEAARIDGATRLQMLYKITLPLIMPSITVCLFLTLSWGFKVFDLIMSLTKGGPFNSTESVSLNIYQEAFRNNALGLGSAKAVIFFLIVAVITILQVTLTKKREVES
ncbi:ABC transporter permease [Cohnella sp. CIP 111063]|uniref:carbohydrate ABC transporter permease n=1 Tax=unclassified Cohnella TaxID=2636738 RepID=UPI000B8C2C2F|nr:MULTISPECIES: sugar ABC transporter permease [unclassified Cohnella]OXS54303.1 ABC transporter permease [Cohnella sp. CIP 111063]PRX63498.1 carbohydrate ABC transporter membrane protein 1 (CUT1 family) [Cohnella sp. SGD-V74]